ncbi:FeoB-associated Cys-rich membrane protein [Paenibacillus senegalimassiliensis]|uniref:FeoB-associated Cys-rich membrane protein n=1 Tax=Paenibacillus senegalimassiliensis TaxID=1737426 RepID=UPI0009E99C66|nr:FeoB-associated Cys-rich membrane protein [Paenibacillus senegalimassiliensis]
MIDYLIVAILAGIIGFTVYRYIKRQKSGGGCAGCSGSCEQFSSCCEPKKRSEASTHRP